MQSLSASTQMLSLPLAQAFDQNQNQTINHRILGHHTSLGDRAILQHSLSLWLWRPPASFTEINKSCSRAGWMVKHPSDVGEEPVRALKWQKSTILSFIQKSTHQTHRNTFDARLMHVSSMIFHFPLQSKYLQLTWSWVEASVNNVLYSICS